MNQVPRSICHKLHVHSIWCQGPCRSPKHKPCYIHRWSTRFSPGALHTPGCYRSVWPLPLRLHRQWQEPPVKGSVADEANPLSWPRVHETFQPMKESGFASQLDVPWISSAGMLPRHRGVVTRKDPGHRCKPTKLGYWWQASWPQSTGKTGRGDAYPCMWICCKQEAEGATRDCVKTLTTGKKIQQYWNRSKVSQLLLCYQLKSLRNCCKSCAVRWSNESVTPVPKTICCSQIHESSEANKTLLHDGIRWNREGGNPEEIPEVAWRTGLSTRWGTVRCRHWTGWRIQFGGKASHSRRELSWNFLSLAMKWGCRWIPRLHWNCSCYCWDPEWYNKSCKKNVSDPKKC